MPNGHRLPASLVTGPVPRLLALGLSAEVAGFTVERCADWADVLERLADAAAIDVVVVDGDSVPASAAEVAAVAERCVLIVVVVEPDADHAPGWLRQGADDVVDAAELAGAIGARRVRFAIERRRGAVARRAAYSTDPATGLPHRQQLVEHLSQLLALREREPAPMAVLALRIEGLRPRDAGAEGGDADIVRRKIAVRLRAGVRSSDVVAAVDDDTFAVLLGSILTPADADKRRRQAGRRAGRAVQRRRDERSIAVALGVAHYPRDGQRRRAPAAPRARPGRCGAGDGDARRGRVRRWRARVTRGQRRALAERAADRGAGRRDVPDNRGLVPISLSLRTAAPVDATPSSRKPLRESLRDPFDVPAVLRLEGTHDRGVEPGGARRRPDAAVHERRHEPVQGRLPRLRQAPLRARGDGAEVHPRRRQAQRPRERRLHRAPSHLLRDARQLQLRRLLQEGRDQVRLGAADRGLPAAEGQALGDGLRRRRRGLRHLEERDRPARRTDRAHRRQQGRAASPPTTSG